MPSIKSSGGKAGVGVKVAKKDAVEKHSLRQQIEYYKTEREILLALSNDITKVRGKDDLIKVFSSRLKQYFYFTHAVISLINHQKKTYYPFLIDRESMPIRHRTELPSLLKMEFVITDPFLTQVKSPNTSAAFLLDDIINEPGIPGFLKVNYECGIRKAMIVELKNKMETFGHVLMYSDKTDSFPDDFKDVLEGIAPHLSNAVTNIIINQEMSQKDNDKSFLIDFSHDIALTRTKNELNLAIHQSLKKLAQIKTYFIRTLDDNGITLSPFMHDEKVFYENDPGFKHLYQTKMRKDEGITGRVLSGNAPVQIDFAKEVKQGNTDYYIEFWKSLGPEKAGFQKMVGVPLKTGTAMLGVLWVITQKINLELLEGISAQISIAISNIRSNEEIAEREAEKSALLSLSEEIAALKKKEDLQEVVNKQFKTLFSIEDFGFLQINEDHTYSSFMLDLGNRIKAEPGYDEITSEKFPVGDPVFEQMMNSENPVVFEVDKLAAHTGMPSYVYFWKKLGVKRILGTALRVGGKNIGCAFLHIDTNKSGKLKINLLKAVCAHISVAVSNIISTEQIYKKHKEQTFLLEFSNDIARVRTKAELQAAIFKVLEKTMHIQLAMIQVIDEDGFNLSPFMYDTTLYDKSRSKSFFDEMVARRVTINEYYTTKVLASDEGVVLNVDDEAATGNPYARLWQTTGFKHTYALPLRTGSKNLGTIWLHANHVSELMVKGICAQISIAIANIQANEKLLAYKKQLEVENDYLREQISTLYNFSDIIGSGPEMQKVYHLMSLVAESNSTVLLLGETGTGKELIARAIHNASPRKDKLMVKVNCAALPPNLIESELFGHEKGAFTGAIERRIGKFELANNSTLFLDEIGEMPLETQVKLLRVLQERELERVGGKTTIKVDVRIIAATNRNLESEVKSGRFRSDLFYRLNVFPITLPPLRNRIEDIEALAVFFLARYCKNSGKNITSISAKCLRELKGYAWPGNVRELEHLIERSILLTQGNVLNEIQLPKAFGNEDNDYADASNKTLEELERNYIIEVLKKCSGKISGSGGAAGALGIPSTTLHSKMKKLNIMKGDYFQ
ncbi:sigma 54-interacting transcriptional regulator [Parafilimonas terrae]|uniref:Transcriptional regulator containing GAF, AAA-type ATPase, and DNA-binding Fis domains n=1 Tax=Parafilimonas terrae TaxID=1465490 RepID=A0A1I5V5Z3_9BACT|nr:sigma 54-interacting transcriptional regulator [Parafilimonas terrae]SFQ02767.1 Transcriptional regulator containing GAF, AAA-type ATPase, and DNA-binding Fis domains [Parafilimonas terrae]